MEKEEIEHVASESGGGGGDTTSHGKRTFLNRRGFEESPSIPHREMAITFFMTMNQHSQPPANR